VAQPLAAQPLAAQPLAAQPLAAQLLAAQLLAAQPLANQLAGLSEDLLEDSSGAMTKESKQIIHF
jgi:hypothetical protein